MSGGSGGHDGRSGGGGSCGGGSGGSGCGSSGSGSGSGGDSAPFTWKPLDPATHPYLSSNRRPSFLQTAAAVCTTGFNPADLWELHQYYFCPPASAQAPAPAPTFGSAATFLPPTLNPSTLDPSTYPTTSLLDPTHTTHPTHATHTTHTSPPLIGITRTRSRPSELTHIDHDDCRPAKRQGNRSTVARIACYPRIKRLLETYKGENNEAGTLKLLRLLRYVEEAEETITSWGHNSTEQLQHNTEALVIELLENN